MDLFNGLFFDVFQGQDVVSSDKKGYTIELPLPGVKKADISLEVDANRLIVKSPGGRFSRVSTRSWAISDGLDSGKIEASYEDGVLRIFIPYAAERQAQRRLIQLK